MKLAELAWPDVPAGALLAVPLGSTEQHGPHLPFTVDTEIAVWLVERLAETCPDTVAAPTLAYGSSGEHAGFPGTLSIGQAALELVVVELVRSADAFKGVVLVCAHGGNAAPLGRAVAVLTAEGRRVRSWSPSFGGDLHAGWDETSTMLALRPESVQLGRAQAGARASMEDLHARGVKALAPNGVLGDPAGASAERGRALLEAAAADLVAVVSGWRP